MPRIPLQSTNMEEIKKGAWSPEEDQKLKSYIMRFGIWNWNQMPKFAGLSRTGKSCRLRWMNYLRPDVKRGPFTMEEVEIVIKTYQELGNRWSAIAGKLTGRTDNEIKNFFHTHLKRHLGLKNDAPRARSNKKAVKKAKENERINVENESDDGCNSSGKSNITREENQMVDVSMDLSQTHYYDVVDQVVISNNTSEISAVILESNPESGLHNLGCQLCQFEYPHSCTISDGASFDQFDVLWEAEHLIF